MNIGLYLKKKREEKGYTQAQLAELAGVDESTVKRLEKKVNPKETKCVKRIYEILGIQKSDEKNESIMTFNKQIECLNLTDILTKLEINDAQKLYMKLDEKLVDAHNLVKESNYKEALDIYLAFLKIFPCEFIYVECADIYYMSENYESAINYSNKALQINENNYNALLIKGISLAYVKKYSDSVEVLKRAMKVKETYEIHYNLGVSYHMSGNTKDAIIYYKKSLEIEYYMPSAHLNIGICYFNEGNLEKSLNHINEAIRLEPNMYQAYGRKGEHYRYIEQHDKAIKYFEKCLKLDPDNHQALFGISISLSEKGKISEAIIYLKRFFNLYMNEYMNDNKEGYKDILLVDIGYKRIRLISFEYQCEDIIKVGIYGKYFKVNMKKDNALIFIGALPISNETGSMLYPTVGKIYKNKEEFNKVINTIKERTELFQYFDKPIYIDFNENINVNIYERKKDVFIEMFFDKKYSINGITDTKSQGFDMFMKLYKKYGQCRIHIQCCNDVFIIDALKHISIKLLNEKK